MKIRTDFVTNSSSSSFIIQTNNEPPAGYEKDLKKITKESLPSFLNELIENCWHDSVCYGFSNKEIMNLLNITEEQLNLLILVNEGKLNTYLKVIKALKESNDPVYYLEAGDDWLYYHTELENFINGADILEEERD